MNRLVKTVVAVLLLSLGFCVAGFSQSGLTSECANYPIEYVYEMSSAGLGMNFPSNITVGKLMQPSNFKDSFIPVADGTSISFKSYLKNSEFPPNEAIYTMYCHVKGINQSTGKYIDEDMFKLTLDFDFDKINKLAVLSYIRIDDFSTGNVIESYAFVGDVKSNVKNLMYLSEMYQYFFNMD